MKLNVKLVTRGCLKQNLDVPHCRSRPKKPQITYIQHRTSENGNPACIRSPLLPLSRTDDTATFHHHQNSFLRVKEIQPVPTSPAIYNDVRVSFATYRGQSINNQATNRDWGDRISPTHLVSPEASRHTDEIAQQSVPCLCSNKSFKSCHSHSTDQTSTSKVTHCNVSPGWSNATEVAFRRHPEQNVVSAQKHLTTSDKANHEQLQWGMASRVSATHRPRGIISSSMTSPTFVSTEDALFIHYRSMTINRRNHENFKTPSAHHLLRQKVIIIAMSHCVAWDFTLSLLVHELNEGSQGNRKLMSIDD